MRIPSALFLALAASLLLSSCVGDEPGAPTAPPTAPATGTSSTPTATTPTATAPTTTPSVPPTTPSAEPSATPSVEPAPTAAPTTAPGTVVPAVPASIIVGAEAVDVVDASGTSLLSLPYSSDGDAALGRFTEILGAPVSSETIPQTPHTSPVDVSHWGGFSLGIHRYLPEDGRLGGDQHYVPRFSVFISEPATSAGVTISAIDGTQVGDSFSRAAEGKPQNQVALQSYGPLDTVALELPTSFPGVVDGDYETQVYGVIARSTEGSDSVSYFSSPGYLVQGF